MSAPIFIDPLLDGAADPTVIWNPFHGEWWMFYTNRRAHLETTGWGWISGSPIGIATSKDGASWDYRGTVAGLDLPTDTGLNTHWAPEVIFAEGEFHMYLTYFSGAPETIENAVRDITHFTSPDLEVWTRQSVLPLQKPNVMDACVAKCPDGLYRMWYKDEHNGCSTWSATSSDLYSWTKEQLVVPGSPDAPRHEGPNVITLGGYHWLITDEWRGLAVFRSDDMLDWTRQGLILDKPGAHPMDRCFARHADIIINEDFGALYYFTHPEWDESAKPIPETGHERRTVIHVAKIWVENGVLCANRDIDASEISLDLPGE